MIKYCELKHNQLKRTCDSSNFSFQSTKELPSFTGLLGQEKAFSELEFALKIKQKGFNIFICGYPGIIGKTDATSLFIKEHAKNKKNLSDWCYIHNFENINEPIAVALQKGHGCVFKKDMDEFVEIILDNLNKTFNNDDFENDKKKISSEFESRKNKLLEELNVIARNLGFEIKNTKNGIYFMPVYKGKTLDENEFEQLDTSIKEAYEKKSEEMQNDILNVMHQIKEIEKEENLRLKDWKNNIAIFAIALHLRDLKNKYAKNPKIINFLSHIQPHILSNLDSFITIDQNLNSQNPWDYYKVNVFIDNQKNEHVPVITENNPTYFNLFGKLEFENTNLGVKSDFSMLKPGLLHKANGGFLVMPVKYLLSNAIVWENLKKVLFNDEIHIDSFKEITNNSVISSLKPEPIQLDVKIVLIGDCHLYEQLSISDPDFKRLFRIKIEFEELMARTESNILKLARFVGTFCNNNNLPHFDAKAFAKFVEYSCKLAEHQDKISTNLAKLIEVIVEAGNVAIISKSNLIEERHIQIALRQKSARHEVNDKKMLDLIDTGTIMIATYGSRVGQLNGLAVQHFNDISFGKPVRITANTYVGKKGIINIEQEAQLSGNTHSKGMLILSGYIGEKFAQHFPLSLTASVCFEQLYSGIDGDSASSTELYAILSSLSELPINQGIAVTGSVNQKGEIQAIGSVTEKIEGYFSVCKQKKLTGNQGILMPFKNIKNLNLNDEVIEAVRKNLFHIYAVSSIDEGIEILTGVPGGKKDDEGKYPEGTVNYYIYEKLKRYHQEL